MLAPGEFVRHPQRPDWGLGQIQSMIGHRITVNFENAGKVVIDAGTKTLTSDRNVTAPDSGHGRIVEYPEATITRLSEEHGEVDVTRCERRPRIGERVTVIPNHICPCVNLQDAVWLRREDGGLEPMRVDARGRLS